MKIGHERINEILQSGQPIGSDYTCKDYPCHFEGQDCTWCHCPFYPCEDKSTGGKNVKSEWTGETVWSCIDCAWIHESDVAKSVLAELLGTAKTIDKIPRKKLIDIRLKMLKGASPRHTQSIL